MRRSRVPLSLMLIVSLLASTSEAQRRRRATKRTPKAPPPATKVTRIAFVADGQGRRVADLAEVFSKEIKALAGTEFAVDLPPRKRLYGDGTLRTVSGHVAKLLADPEVQLVIGLGPLSSHVLAKQKALPKPVIANYIMDPAAQGVPLKDDVRSGVHNLSYLTTPFGVIRSIEAFRQLLPFKRLAMLLPESYIEAFGAVGAQLLSTLKTKGIVVEFVTLAGPASEVLARLPKGCDSAYLVVHPDHNYANLEALVSGLTSRKIPSFTPVGSQLVERGVLAGIAVTDRRDRQVRRVALNVQRVLMGQDPATFPVKITYGAPKLTINMRTARALSYRPTWAVLSEATLVGRKRGRRRSLTLAGAVKAALEANLTLIAGQRNIEAGIYEVRKAISGYLPKVDLRGTGVIIDEDRANPLFGAYERTLTGSLGVSQLLFNEKALANISIQKRLQRSREQQLEQIKLEVMEAVAVAYVQLLKARTAERIRKENLKVTKTNLELAQLRRSIGASGMADVHRWQNQLANDKRAVITAIATRNQAEIALNALQRRPLEEPFELASRGSMTDSNSTPPRGRLARFVNNPWSFQTMRAFMVAEGLRRSPELRRIDQQLEAKRRQRLSAKLDYFVPQLALSFGLDHRFWTGGKEADPLPAPFDAIGSSGKTDWNLALVLSWRLFDGGAKIYSHLQVDKELAQLLTQRREVSQGVEQRIRIAMHRLGASFPAIRLARQAAEAARKGLALVTDAYSRGSRSIIELIDAQNAALQSDLAAALAHYDFCIDLFRAQRAIGNQQFFIQGASASEGPWLARLERFRRDRERDAGKANGR